MFLEKAHANDDTVSHRNANASRRRRRRAQVVHKSQRVVGRRCTRRGVERRELAIDDEARVPSHLLYGGDGGASQASHIKQAQCRVIGARQHKTRTVRRALDAVDGVHASFVVWRRTGRQLADQQLVALDVAALRNVVDSIQIQHVDEAVVVADQEQRASAVRRANEMNRFLSELIEIRFNHRKRPQIETHFALKSSPEMDELKRQLLKKEREVDYKLNHFASFAESLEQVSFCAVCLSGFKFVVFACISIRLVVEH